MSGLVTILLIRLAAEATPWDFAYYTAPLPEKFDLPE
jgi:hypothetical protein